MTGFSISNIAWPTEADREAVLWAKECGFTGIELAPMKLFGPLDGCPPDRIISYRQQLADVELAIPALQAILFGVEGCELFKSNETRVRLAAHLRLVAKTAGLLGAGACVFGAPTLRDPGTLEPQAAFDIAVDFFRGIAADFADAGTAIAFEANPPHYKCRFITKTEEAIALVSAVDRPGFRMQIDTGTIFINGETPFVAREAAPYAAHFHASEKDLVPLGQSSADHAAVGAALNAAGYNAWRSVEMRATPDWRNNIQAAAELMKRNYHA